MAAFALDLPSDLAELPRLVELTQACRDRFGIPDAVVQQLDLALEEIVTNVISYAHTDGAKHVIHVSIDVDGRQLTATVEDDGRAFNPLDVPAPDVSAPIEDRQVGGLGILLVRQLMDVVRYDRLDGRNRLTLVKRLSELPT